MEVNYLPGFGCGGEGSLQPLRLHRSADDAARLGGVAVNGVEMDRTPGVIVVSLVAGEGEIVKVRLGVGLHPIVVAQGREELVEGRALAVAASIRVDIVVVILADV